MQYRDGSPLLDEILWKGGVSVFTGRYWPFSTHHVCKASWSYPMQSVVRTHENDRSGRMQTDGRVECNSTAWLRHQLNEVPVSGLIGASPAISPMSNDKMKGTRKEPQGRCALCVPYISRAQGIPPIKKSSHR